MIDGSRRRSWILLLLGLWLVASAAVAEIPPVIEAPGPAERQKSERQREQIDALARRRLGVALRGHDLLNLKVLQRLLDERIVERDDVFALQSMGVVLGDVMAANLALHWVVVDDDIGSSRALRYRETKHLFFPVTMISKRVEFGEAVDMRALYDGVADQVATLAGREFPRRARPGLPPRPERVPPE